MHKRKGGYVVEDLLSKLNELDKIHQACLDNNNGIRVQRLEKYVPTDFIYSFFAFKSLYSIDWKSSFESNQVVYWEVKGSNEVNSEQKSEEKGKSELSKINAFVKFCVNELGNETVLLLRDSLKNNLPHTIDILEEIKYIKEDEGTKNRIDVFQNKISDLLIIKDINKSVKKQKRALYIILEFTYIVRCNIFIGTKTTLEKKSSRQQKCLLIYTAILIAASELIFKIANRKLKWKSSRRRRA